MIRFLKIFWKILWNLKTIIITAVLLCSLAINMVLFLGGSLFSLVNSSFEALSGIQTIASRNKVEIANLSEEVILERNAKRQINGQLRETSADLADSRISNQKLKKKTNELSSELLIERKAKRELKVQVAQVSGDLIIERNAKLALDRKVSVQAAELASSRIKNRQLKEQVRDFGMGIIPFKGKKVAIKTAVEETADTIGKRAVKTAKREVASMPAEAIPYLGTAVIASVTALELYDLCATVKDMNELKRAFNPNLQDNTEEVEVCSIKVPPKEEILEKAKNSPRKAWEAANDVVPSWSELKELELPTMDWTELWSSSKAGAAETLDNTSERANELKNKVKKWWEAD